MLMQRCLLLPGDRRKSVWTLLKVCRNNQRYLWINRFSLGLSRINRSVIYPCTQFTEKLMDVIHCLSCLCTIIIIFKKLGKCHTQKDRSLTSTQFLNSNKFIKLFQVSYLSVVNLSVVEIFLFSVTIVMVLLKPWLNMVIIFVFWFIFYVLLSYKSSLAT